MNEPYLSDAAAALCDLVVPELAEELAAALCHDALQDEVVARDEGDDVHVVLRLGAVDARVVHVVPEARRMGFRNGNLLTFDSI